MRFGRLRASLLIPGGGLDSPISWWSTGPAWRCLRGNDSYWLATATEAMARACGGFRRRDPRRRLCAAAHRMCARDVGPDDGGGDVERGAARIRVRTCDVVRGGA